MFALPIHNYCNVVEVENGDDVDAILAVKNHIKSAENGQEMVNINGHILPKSVNEKQIYKVVLTGGPCAGKTSSLARLSGFFESIGWKVFTVPETASILSGPGRVCVLGLDREQRLQFQKDLLKTLLNIEQVYINQAMMCDSDKIMIILDRGALDGSAYIEPAGWCRLLSECGMDLHELRERYNQVCHLVSAADGAPAFYQRANNLSRTEGIAEAVAVDRRTREAWVGHQCLSIIDNNCASFDEKISKLIATVCARLGISMCDRYAPNSKKRKWLVRGVDDEAFGRNRIEQFDVKHLYLKTNGPNQVRLRQRSQNGKSTFTLTTRQYEGPDGQKLPQPVETRKQLNRREYLHFVTTAGDQTRQSIHKQRFCFLFGSKHFNLDKYIEPLPPACSDGLMILETYTTKPPGSPEPMLPHFLHIEREITNDPEYSMFHLASTIDD